MSNGKTKKYPLIALAVLVILLAFYIGVNKSLGGKMKEAAAAFTMGVEGDYGSSISKQLKARIDAANNMQTIAAKYEAVLQEYSALRFARNDLYDLWLAAEGLKADLHAVYEANEKLTERFNAVYDKLHPLATPKQQKEIEGYKSIMDNAQREISESGYNEYIREFYENVLDRFPANALRHICKEKPPQYFK